MRFVTVWKCGSVSIIRSTPEHGWQQRKYKYIPGRAKRVYNLMLAYGWTKYPQATRCPGWTFYEPQEEKA